MTLLLKRLLCLCSFLLLWVSMPVMAQQFERQDRITKTQANQFYTKCLEQSYPANTPEAKEMFCSCSAANFYEQLRQGDLMDLEFEETWQATIAKEKLLQYVYTPCAETTIDDIVAEECYSSTYLDDYPHISKNKFCECQTRRMQIVFRNGLGRITASNLQNLDESLNDPISSFMNNAYYQSQSDAITPICMNNATITVEKLTPIVSHPASVVVQPGGQGGHSHSHGSSGGSGSGSGSSSSSTGSGSSNNGINPNPTPVKLASVDPEPSPPQSEPPKRTKKVCTARVPYDEAYKKENVRIDDE